ncbi:MAG TPA: FAD-dependent oxidoreductase [Longimicrobiales bacterium]|nr:FAD-dependent oxidoreductase [Longimicrobiales bacterium]
MKRWDVVVVGAGPSGALAARESARRGATVLLLDRASFPRWKVCGACLSPGARRILEGVGLGSLPTDLGGVDLRRLVLRAGAGSASVSLRDSLALSRVAFDAALVEAAAAAGAEFWPCARASLGRLEPEERAVRVARNGRTVDVRARVVVDATGLGHGLRAEAAADHGPADEIAEDSRVGLGGVLRGERYPVDAGDLHMTVGRSGYVGIVRLEDGTLNVAAALDRERLRAATPSEAVSEVLAEGGLPPLGEAPLAGWRGTPPLTRAPPDAGARRLLRVGDAIGYVEPFTGEGICWALGAGGAVAELANSAAERWSDEVLEEWSAYRARALGPSQRLCRVLARGLRSRWLVGAGVAALQVAPRLATPFVLRAGRPPAEVGA